MKDHLDLTPSPRLLEVLGDIPYQPWQCLAELIDNSFDSFLTEGPRPAGAERPTVWIDAPKSGQANDPDAFVRVADNGQGMTEETLERSLRAGYSGNPRYGTLGLFGMGFNIATARLGRVVEVRTTKAGDPSWAVAEVDFRDLQARDSFSVPLRYEDKQDLEISGTEISVSQLTSESRLAFRRSQQISAIRTQLSKVYSYLLRDKGVPGIPNAQASGKGYVLKINAQIVRPRLACVWSSDRYVTVRGQDIPAVIPIDHQLSTAYACQACGKWHAYSVDECTECQSDDVQPRERRVRGWLGIQRYLHTTAYGIDFLRHGRKILVEDKRVFTWEDPSGLSSLNEYPIELAHQGGRIVGEIHLDHVGVNYQKNDFTRDTREWIDALRLIKGEGPLQPRKARDLEYEENQSALARLYSGYRRNDPGLKCLIPGDGAGALHEKARQWGKAFHSGQQEYESDSTWYAAAEEHDRIKQGLLDRQEEGGDDLADRMGLDEDPEAPEESDVSEDAETDEPAAVETEYERFERYRSKSHPIPGIDGQISLGRHARKRVAGYLTRTALKDADGRAVPSLSHSMRGGDIEVFVNPNHLVFAEYGRDPRDFALMEIAEALRTMSAGDMSLTSATSDVIAQFPDQRFTDTAMRERAENLLADIRVALAQDSIAPADLWSALPSTSKETTESRAAMANADLDWAQATEDGSYIGYLDATAIAELVREVPQRLFDGQVFQTKYGSWSSDETRVRVADGKARLLDTVGEFLADTSGRSSGDLRLVQVTLDILAASLAHKE